MKLKFKFTERDTEYFDKWLNFYPKKETQSPFKFEIEKYGYFDPRPQFNTNLTSLIAIVLPFFSLWFLFLSGLFLFYGWGSIYLRLPFDTGKGDECESPEYGMMTFTNGKIINQLWVYWGKKRNHIDLPWAFQWVRTSILLKDGSWEHETKGEKKSFYNQEWKDKQKAWNYDYTDSYDDEIIPTIIYVEEREWRPKWFKWTSLFTSINRTIDIHFSKEVGKKKGSWKGGVLGCSYNLLPKENPLDCLKRMEKERKF